MNGWFLVVSVLVAGCGKSAKPSHDANAAPPATAIAARSLDASVVIDAAVKATTDAGAVATRSKVLEVVVSGRVACARRADGRVRCWGSPWDGRGLPVVAAAVEISDLTTAVAIDLGSDQTLSVVTDGGGVRRGKLDLRGTTTLAELDGIEDVVAVRAYGDVPVVLTRTGNVFTPASPSPILTNAIALRRSANGTITGLHRDGRVSWFDGRVREVAKLTDATSLFGDRCAERRTGAKVCWTKGRLTPWVGATNIIDRAHGAQFHCDLTSAGVACGGRILDLPARPVAIAAGWRSACAVLDDGEVACWGSNDGGQLGDGTLLDRSKPILVPGLTTPSPPPPSDGRAQVQQATIAMDWSGLPAACKRPGTIGGLTTVVSGYAYPSRAGTTVWLADFALEPDGYAASLLPVRGTQRALEIALSHGRRPIDRGRYAERGPRRAKLTVHVAETSPEVADRVDLVVELVDKDWICGQLLAVDGAAQRQPFAARVHKTTR
ncbi:MAG: hypothetical protein H0T42_34325 [Deltaproteobacteria bacterium]|nr:hypothetical protein [Deltaproteobacteria bacterium]